MYTRKIKFLKTGEGAEYVDIQSKNVKIGQVSSTWEQLIQHEENMDYEVN